MYLHPQSMVQSWGIRNSAIPYYSTTELIPQIPHPLVTGEGTGYPLTTPYIITKKALSQIATTSYMMGFTNWTKRPSPHCMCAMDGNYPFSVTTKEWYFTLFWW